jgi:hypothetical protein
MRTLFLSFFMLIVPLSLLPQEVEKEFKKFSEGISKEFDESQKKTESEYNTFNDSINADYLNRIIESEKEFSELLLKSFREFKIILPDNPPSEIKPVQIQVYKITPQPNLSTFFSETKISIVDDQDILLPPESIYMKKETGVMNKTSLEFLGNSFIVEFDSNMSQIPELVITDAETIRNSFDYIRNTNYPGVLKQLVSISSQMNLNDWDYFCLINEFSKLVVDKPNSQKFIMWFLLLESNYKVKIGYHQDTLSILFAPAQTLYNMPWYNIKGERYYSMQNEPKTIKTYDIDYFKGYKYVNMFHTKPLILEESKKTKTITFPFMGETYSIPISFNQRYVDYYSTYPLLPVEYYFASPVSSIFKESVHISIAPYLQNKTQLESLHYLLSLVQYGFNYKTDIEQFNHEKYMVPEEIVYYNNSDCDDKTILFTYLVRELLHLDVIALSFKGHICSAVEVSDHSIKANLTYNGKQYVACDATYSGAPPGIILPPFMISNAVIIDFNNYLNNFHTEKQIWASANKKGLLQSENTSNISVSQDGTSFLTGIMNFDKLAESAVSKVDKENAMTFIARLDSAKNIKWLKRLQGTGTNFGYCISQTTDQFLYVFGYFEDTLALDNYKISAQDGGSFYLAKLNELGQSIWLEKILLPVDSLSRGLTAVLDSNGKLKYYMPNDHFPHENNYLMNVDDKGYCYIYAMLPSKMSGLNLSKYYASGEHFDIVSYLLKGNDNLLKQNYPKSLSMLFSLFQYLTNYGSVIQGTALKQTLLTAYGSKIPDFTNKYPEIGMISEMSNAGGITLIKTVNCQPVTINPLQAQHESRLKLTYINGNAKIDILNGVKIGNNQIWNDLNYILLDKTTGEVIYNYDNQYRKKMPVHTQIL